MDKQAREAREQMKALPFKEKWNNFWYYYKKHVLIAIFVLIVAGFSIAQCANRIDYDLNISFYTSYGAPTEGIEKLETMMSEVTEDTNENDAVDVFIALYMANPNEMNEQTQAVNMKLMAEMAAGESMAYIFDETYKEIALNQFEELGETILEISEIPQVKGAIMLPESEKLYWFTKTVYETEKDDEEKLAEHENAVRVEEMLIEMGATVIEDKGL